QHAIRAWAVLCQPAHCAQALVGSMTAISAAAIRLVTNRTILGCWSSRTVSNAPRPPTEEPRIEELTADRAAAGDTTTYKTLDPQVSFKRCTQVMTRLFQPEVR